MFELYHLNSFASKSWWWTFLEDRRVASDPRRSRTERSGELDAMARSLLILRSHRIGGGLTPQHEPPTASVPQGTVMTGHASACAPCDPSHAPACAPCAPSHAPACAPCAPSHAPACAPCA